MGYAVDPDNPTADCIGRLSVAQYLHLTSSSMLCFLCTFLDINECVNETIICPDGARCNNTEGSFFCECKDGFTEVEQLCLSEWHTQPSVPYS